MTTKEASDKFKLNIEDIRSACNDNLIPNAYKPSGKWIIPDDTEIILTKMQARKILLDILKYKNNNLGIISGEYTHNSKNLDKAINLLAILGFIGEYTFNLDIKSLFNTIQLTETGFALLIGGNTDKSKNIYFNLVNFNLNIGLLNL